MFLFKACFTGLFLSFTISKFSLYQVFMSCCINGSGSCPALVSCLLGVGARCSAPWPKVAGELACALHLASMEVPMYRLASLASFYRLPHPCLP